MRTLSTERLTQSNKGKAKYTQLSAKMSEKITLAYSLLEILQEIDKFKTPTIYCDDYILYFFAPN